MKNLVLKVLTNEKRGGLKVDYLIGVLFLAIHAEIFKQNDGDTSCERPKDTQ
jgi:hypothetical protein